MTMLRERLPEPVRQLRAIIAVPAILALLLLLGAAAPGVGAAVTYEASLDGGQVNPPTGSRGGGIARLTVDAAGTEATWHVEVSGLQGRITSAVLRRSGGASPGPVLLEIAPADLAAGVWRLDAAALSDLRNERISLVVGTDVYPTGEVEGVFRQQSLASDKATWGRLKAIFNGS